MPLARVVRLALVLSGIAFVAVGGAAVMVPQAAPVFTASTIDLGRGITHAVDGTLADPADTRTSRSDRQAPRNDDLPFVLPLAAVAVGLAVCGAPGDRGSGRGARVRLRDSIGRRAPPGPATT